MIWFIIVWCALFFAAAIGDEVMRRKRKNYDPRFDW
jgi:hypothetical protein